MRRLLTLLVLMLTPSLCFAQASVHTIAGVNAQTGTSYTIQAVDQTKLLTFNNANPVAVTLPSAVTANFGVGAIFAIRNLGAGAVTITPIGSTIDGATSLVLSQGQGADIYSDGSNYVSQKGAGGGGLVSGMTPNQVPIAATSNSIASSKPVQGTDTSIMSSGFVSGTAAPLCTDASAGATTSGCPNISGAISGQVAIAGSPNTVTSSKAIQGTETNLLSSDGSGSTGLPYCRSASGGATTAGCPAGGGAPGGTPVQAQFNNTGAFGGSSCFNLTTFPNGPANLDCDTHPIGPNPAADITRYGARFKTAVPIATGTCTSGSNQITAVTVTQGSFQVGDYILGGGCGTPITMTTPGAPTVTSGASGGATVPDAQVFAATGAQTDSYAIVAKDNNGGLTLPSATTTTTTAVALGQQTAAVTTVSSFAQTLTITLSSAGPPNGARFHLTYVAQGAGQTNHKFDGYYNVCSGGGTTSIIVCNMPYWSIATDSTAASIIWFDGDKLGWVNPTGTWAMYVCGHRPGDSAGLHFLGSGIPATSGGITPPFTNWVDWGTTLTPATPSGFPEGTDAICTASTATSDYLDNVKITACSPSNCGTGSTWTISANAGTTKVGATIVQDDAPALAAANAAFTNLGIGLTIPCTNNPSAFLDFFSPQSITTLRNWVDQCGLVTINETIDLGAASGGSTPWIGRSPFNQNSNPANINFSAYPALNDISVLNNIVFNAQGNDGSLAAIQSGFNTTWLNADHNKFLASGYSSMGLLSTGTSPGFGYLTNTFQNMGPGNSPSFFDTTWTPWLYFDALNNNAGVNLYFRNDYGFGRGIYFNNLITSGPMLLDFNQHYCQGCIMPLTGFYGGNGSTTSINIHGNVNDTSPQPMFNFDTNPASPASQFVLRTKDSSGLPANLYTGWSPIIDWNEGDYAGVSGFQYPSKVFPDPITGYGKLALQTSVRSDAFNRGSLGANWTQALNTVQTTNNQITGNVNSWNVAYEQNPGPVPNGYPNPNTGGEYCIGTITNYASSQGGCTLFAGGVNTTDVGFTCSATGSAISILIPNSTTLAGPQAYTGGGNGDMVLETASSTLGGNTALSCTVFPINGAPSTLTFSSGIFFKGYPGVALFGNTGFTMDNFSGGSLNPAAVSSIENYFTQPQHFVSGTVGNPSPTPGVLPYGFWSVGSLLSTGYVEADGLNSQYDGFNRANGAIGANWTAVTGTTAPTITSNQILGNAAGDQAAAYTATTFSPDQFSQITAPVGGATAGVNLEATCRMITTAQTYYIFSYTGASGAFQLFRVNAGVFTQLGSNVVKTLTGGDLIRIECVSYPPVITGFQISGGVKTQIIQQTDTSTSALATGQPGFDIVGNVSQSVIDNWSGGNVNPLTQPTIEHDWLTPMHAPAMTLGSNVPIAGALPYGYLSVGAYTDFFQQPSSPPPNPPPGYCRGFFAFGGTMTFTNSAGTSCGPPGGGGGMVFPATVGLTRWTGGAAWAASVNDTAALTGQPLVATNGAASSFSSPGIQDGNALAHVTTTPYSVLCDSATALRDRGTTIIFDSGASVVNLPDHTLSGCANNDAFVLINNSGGNLTVNRGGTDTLDIYGLVGASTIAATSFTFAYNNWAAVNNGEAGRWNVRLAGNVPLPNTTTSTGTSAIAANTCTTPTTVTMTGLATTQTIVFTPNADVSGIAGWGSTGGLVIDTWPTANTVNYRVCNPTGSSITPGSAITWNISAR